MYWRMPIAARGDTSPRHYHYQKVINKWWNVNIYVMMGLESVWQEWRCLDVNIYERGWGVECVAKVDGLECQYI